MKLIIEGYNKSIHKKDNQIVVKEKDELIYKIPADDIDDITIVGKGYITFDALSLLSRNNVNLITVNYFGQVEYMLEKPSQKYVQLKKEQYKSSDNENGLKIAIEIVKAKIKNQKSTIKTLNKNKKIKKVKENENKIKEYLIELEKLEIRDDSSIKNVIMGIEGKVSVLYWDSISRLLPESVNFKNRNQKPENDVVNAMLNYGYAILASQITKSILLHGLDAYCGFLHADRYKRTSLTYDLIEEFRQQIVDKTVIKLINYKPRPNYKTIKYSLVRKGINYTKRKIVNKTTNSLILEQKNMDKYIENYPKTSEVNTAPQLYALNDESHLSDSFPFPVPSRLHFDILKSSMVIQYDCYSFLKFLMFYIV